MKEKIITLLITVVVIVGVAASVGLLCSWLLEKGPERVFFMDKDHLQKQINLLSVQDYLWFAADIATKNEEHKTATYLYRAIIILDGGSAYFADPNIQIKYLEYSNKLWVERKEQFDKLGMSEN